MIAIISLVMVRQPNGAMGSVGFTPFPNKLLVAVSHSAQHKHE